MYSPRKPISTPRARHRSAQRDRDLTPEQSINGTVDEATAPSTPPTSVTSFSPTGRRGHQLSGTGNAQYRPQSLKKDKPASGSSKSMSKDMAELQPGVSRPRNLGSIGEKHQARPLQDPRLLHRASTFSSALSESDHAFSFLSPSGRNPLSENKTPVKSPLARQQPAHAFTSPMPYPYPGTTPTPLRFQNPPRINNPHGEAAEYYGDQGQSIQYQPGIRPQTPILEGTQPHLLAPLPEPRPPVEPSSMGLTGAAAEFYGQQPPQPQPPPQQLPPAANPYTQPPIAPHQSYGPSPSAPELPQQFAEQHNIQNNPSFGIGPIAFHQNLEDDVPHGPSTTNAGNHHINQNGLPGHPHPADAQFGTGTLPHQCPHNIASEPPPPLIYPGAPNQTHPSHGRPQLYVNTHIQPSPLQQQYPPHQYQPSPSTPLTLMHSPQSPTQRHRNPFGWFVDFLKDKEGVGRYEDYSQAAGICKYCFDEGTTSAMAPRKHNYQRTLMMKRKEREQRLSRNPANMTRVGKNRWHQRNTSSSSYSSTSSSESNRLGRGGSRSRGKAALAAAAAGVAAGTKMKDWAQRDRGGSLSDASSVRSERGGHYGYKKIHLRDNADDDRLSGDSEADELSDSSSKAPSSRNSSIGQRKSIQNSRSSSRSSASRKIKLRRSRRSGWLNFWGGQNSPRSRASSRHSSSSSSSVNSGLAFGDIYIPDERPETPPKGRQENVNDRLRALKASALALAASDQIDEPRSRNFRTAGQHSPLPIRNRIQKQRSRLLLKQGDSPSNRAAISRAHDKHANNDHMTDDGWEEVGSEESSFSSQGEGLSDADKPPPLTDEEKQRAHDDNYLRYPSYSSSGQDSDTHLSSTTSQGASWWPWIFTKPRRRRRRSRVLGSRLSQRTGSIGSKSSAGELRDEHRGDRVVPEIRGGHDSSDGVYATEEEPSQPISTPLTVCLPVPTDNPREFDVTTPNPNQEPEATGDPEAPAELAHTVQRPNGDAQGTKPLPLGKRSSSKTGAPERTGGNSQSPLKKHRQVSHAIENDVPHSEPATHTSHDDYRSANHEFENQQRDPDDDEYATSESSERVKIEMTEEEEKQAREKLEIEEKKERQQKEREIEDATRKINEDISSAENSHASSPYLNRIPQVVVQDTGPYVAPGDEPGARLPRDLHDGIERLPSPTFGRNSYGFDSTDPTVVGVTKGQGADHSPTDIQIEGGSRAGHSTKSEEGRRSDIDELTEDSPTYTNLNDARGSHDLPKPPIDRPLPVSADMPAKDRVSEHDEKPRVDAEAQSPDHSRHLGEPDYHSDLPSAPNDAITPLEPVDLRQNMDDRVAQDDIPLSGQDHRMGVSEHQDDIWHNVQEGDEMEERNPEPGDAPEPNAPDHSLSKDTSTSENMRIDPIQEQPLAHPFDDQSLDQSDTDQSQPQPIKLRPRSLNDWEFAAALAAGTDLAGFDSNIVTDNLGYEDDSPSSRAKGSDHTEPFPEFENENFPEAAYEAPQTPRDSMPSREGIVGPQYSHPFLPDTESDGEVTPVVPHDDARPLEESHLPSSALESKAGPSKDTHQNHQYNENVQSDIAPIEEQAETKSANQDAERSHEKELDTGSSSDYVDKQPIPASLSPTLVPAQGTEDNQLHTAEAQLFSHDQHRLPETEEPSHTESDNIPNVLSRQSSDDALLSHKSRDSGQSGRQLNHEPIETASNDLGDAQLPEEGVNNVAVPFSPFGDLAEEGSTSNTEAQEHPCLSSDPVLDNIEKSELRESGEPIESRCSSLTTPGVGNGDEHQYRNVSGAVEPSTPENNSQSIATDEDMKEVNHDGIADDPVRGSPSRENGDGKEQVGILNQTYGQSSQESGEAINPCEIGRGKGNEYVGGKDDDDDDTIVSFFSMTEGPDPEGHNETSQPQTPSDMVSDGGTASDIPPSSPHRSESGRSDVTARAHSPTLQGDMLDDSQFSGESPVQDLEAVEHALLNSAPIVDQEEGNNDNTKADSSAPVASHDDTKDDRDGEEALQTPRSLDIPHDAADSTVSVEQNKHEEPDLASAASNEELMKGQTNDQKHDTDNLNDIDYKNDDVQNTKDTSHEGEKHSSVGKPDFSELYQPPDSQEDARTSSPQQDTEEIPREEDYTDLKIQEVPAHDRNIAAITTDEDTVLFDTNITPLSKMEQAPEDKSDIPVQSEDPKLNQHEEISDLHDHPKEDAANSSSGIDTHEQQKVQAPTTDDHSAQKYPLLLLPDEGLFSQERTDLQHDDSNEAEPLRGRRQRADSTSSRVSNSSTATVNRPTSRHMKGLQFMKRSLSQSRPSIAISAAKGAGTFYEPSSAASEEPIDWERLNRLAQQHRYRPRTSSMRSRSSTVSTNAEKPPSFGEGTINTSSPGATTVPTVAITPYTEKESTTGNEHDGRLSQLNFTCFKNERPDEPTAMADNNANQQELTTEVMPDPTKEGIIDLNLQDNTPVIRKPETTDFYHNTGRVNSGPESPQHSANQALTVEQSVSSDILSIAANTPLPDDEHEEDGLSQAEGDDMSEELGPNNLSNVDLALRGGESPYLTLPGEHSDASQAIESPDPPNPTPALPRNLASAAETSLSNEVDDESASKDRTSVAPGAHVPPTALGVLSPEHALSPLLEAEEPRSSPKISATASSAASSDEKTDEHYIDPVLNYNGQASDEILMGQGTETNTSAANLNDTSSSRELAALLDIAATTPLPESDEEDTVTNIQHDHTSTTTGGNDAEVAYDVSTSTWSPDEEKDSEVGLPRDAIDASDSDSHTSLLRGRSDNQSRSSNDLISNYHSPLREEGVTVVYPASEDGNEIRTSGADGTDTVPNPYPDDVAIAAQIPLPESEDETKTEVLGSNEAKVAAGLNDNERENHDLDPVEHQNCAQGSDTESVADPPSLGSEHENNDANDKEGQPESPGNVHPRGDETAHPNSGLTGHQNDMQLNEIAIAANIPLPESEDEGEYPDSSHAEWESHFSDPLLIAQENEPRGLDPKGTRDSHSVSDDVEIAASIPLPESEDEEDVLGSGAHAEETDPLRPVPDIEDDKSTDLDSDDRQVRLQDESETGLGGPLFEPQGKNEGLEFSQPVQGTSLLPDDIEVATNIHVSGNGSMASVWNVDNDPSITDNPPISTSGLAPTGEHGIHRTDAVLQRTASSPTDVEGFIDNVHVPHITDGVPPTSLGLHELETQLLADNDRHARHDEEEKVIRSMLDLANENIFADSDRLPHYAISPTTGQGADLVSSNLSAEPKSSVDSVMADSEVPVSERGLQSFETTTQDREKAIADAVETPLPDQSEEELAFLQAERYDDNGESAATDAGVPPIGPLPQMKRSAGSPVESTSSDEGRRSRRPSPRVSSAFSALLPKFRSTGGTPVSSPSTRNSGRSLSLGVQDQPSNDESLLSIRNLFPSISSENLRGDSDNKNSAPTISSGRTSSQSVSGVHSTGDNGNTEGPRWPEAPQITISDDNEVAPVGKKAMESKFQTKSKPAAFTPSSSRIPTLKVDTQFATADNPVFQGPSQDQNHEEAVTPVTAVTKRRWWVPQEKGFFTRVLDTIGIASEEKGQWMEEITTTTQPAPPKSALGTEAPLPPNFSGASSLKIQLDRQNEVSEAREIPLPAEVDTDRDSADSVETYILHSPEHPEKATQLSAANQTAGTETGNSILWDIRHLYEEEGDSEGSKNSASRVDKSQKPTDLNGPKDSSCSLELAKETPLPDEDEAERDFFYGSVISGDKEARPATVTLEGDSSAITTDTPRDESNADDPRQAEYAETRLDTLKSPSESQTSLITCESSQRDSDSGPFRPLPKTRRSEKFEHLLGQLPRIRPSSPTDSITTGDKQQKDSRQSPMTVIDEKSPDTATFQKRLTEPGQTPSGQATSAQKDRRPERQEILTRTSLEDVYAQRSKAETAKNWEIKIPKRPRSDQTFNSKRNQSAPTLQGYGHATSSASSLEVPSRVSSRSSPADRLLRRINRSNSLRARQLADHEKLSVAPRARAATGPLSHGINMENAAWPSAARSPIGLGGQVEPTPTDISRQREVIDEGYNSPDLEDETVEEIFEGVGRTVPGSPLSPSRPSSIRHRRSIERCHQLESRIEELTGQNKELVARGLEHDKQRQENLTARRQAEKQAHSRGLELQCRDLEIQRLKSQIGYYDTEYEKLKETNEGLTTQVSELTSERDALNEQYRKEKEERQRISEEYEHLKTDHGELAGKYEELVERSDRAVEEKAAEIEQLRDQLAHSKAKVKELQKKITEGIKDDGVVLRDKEFFEQGCQKLCQHIKQWAVRFSKHSDKRVCRTTAEMHDPGIIKRFRSIVLDDTDVDDFLSDRVRRRDAFTAVISAMIYENVFNRYLFGMDREQRKQIKALERKLLEVGPRRAVQKWRSITLSILVKHAAFEKQRKDAIDSTAQDIYHTLSRLLPPPADKQATVIESLKTLVRVAVDIANEMRLQRAEYAMLRPFQQKLDETGQVADKYYFDASIMNDASADKTLTNEQLEQEQAVVRLVLFPMIVKKTNDDGDEDDEVVVSPAQVLVATEQAKDKKAMRVASSQPSLASMSRSKTSAFSSMEEMR